MNILNIFWSWFEIDFDNFWVFTGKLGTNVDLRIASKIRLMNGIGLNRISLWTAWSQLELSVGVSLCVCVAVCIECASASVYTWFVMRRSSSEGNIIAFLESSTPPFRWSGKTNHNMSRITNQKSIDITSASNALSLSLLIEHVKHCWNEMKRNICQEYNETVPLTQWEEREREKREKIKSWVCFHISTTGRSSIVFMLFHLSKH